MDAQTTQVSLPEVRSRVAVAPGPGLSAAGGIFAALGAAACCVVPFALFMLGVTGAWIGDLTALEPYKPIFAAVSVGAIGYGAWRLRRKSKLACADGYCATPRADRIAKIGLWAAAILLVIALVFPYTAEWFLAS